MQTGRLLFSHPRVLYGSPTRYTPPAWHFEDLAKSELEKHDLLTLAHLEDEGIAREDASRFENSFTID